jgi:hypothetical protein
MIILYESMQHNYAMFNPSYHKYIIILAKSAMFYQPLSNNYNVDIASTLLETIKSSNNLYIL